jgi:type IV secretory pathway VirB3-like protein
VCCFAFLYENLSIPIHARARQRCLSSISLDAKIIMTDSPRMARDLAALLRLQFAPLIALPVGWLLVRFGLVSLVYVAGLLALIGIVLLILARLPLYRQRKFTSFGPQHLDTQHKRLYWRGYAFIVVSLLLCVFVLALPT